jgi:hypothetical protein
MSVRKIPEITLPSFEKSLTAEDGWTRIEGDFIIIYAVNVSFIGSDMMVS